MLVVMIGMMMVMMMMTMTIALVLILFSLHLIALAPSTQNAPLPRMPSSPTSWTLRSLSRPFPLPPTTPRSTPAPPPWTDRGTYVLDLTATLTPLNWSDFFEEAELKHAYEADLLYQRIASVKFPL